MNLFETVRTNVKAIDVVSMAGLKPNRSKMICCPFHNDKHPSMKVDRRYFCFGCGAKGDAVDFVANCYGLSLKEAAEKAEITPSELALRWTVHTEGITSVILGASKIEHFRIEQKRR